MEQFEDAPFAIIGINADTDLDMVKKKNIEHKVSWRNFWNGPRGGQGPISTAWGIKMWPTIYLIDHEGVIHLQMFGDTGYKDNPTNEELDEIIKGLVEKAEAAS